MIEIKITGQNRVEKALVKLDKEIRKPVAALHEIGMVMLASVDKNFDEQGRPEKWRPLSPMTLAMRRNKDKQSVKILQDTGTLRKSISYQITDDGEGIAVGTIIEYGKIHQLGGTSRIPARIIVPKAAKVLRFVTKEGKVVFTKRVKQKARLAIVPRRPFLLFQEQDLEDIQKILVEHLKESTKE